MPAETHKAIAKYLHLRIGDVRRLAEREELELRERKLAKDMQQVKRRLSAFMLP